MGSVVNGMALSHLKSYGSTFLVFPITCAPRCGCRRSMELGDVWVYTHDSIGVGEDGPTHQPIEHLAILRSTPGLDTIRPGDANEVAWAWRAAMQNSGTPTVLVLSRQALPTLDREHICCRRRRAQGWLCLADSENPEVVLIATGS